MTATTWRINAIDTGGHDLELSALALYDAATSADTGAAVTSSHAPASGTLANLTDGNTATACRFAAADVRSPGFFIQWVLPAARDVSAIRLGGGSSEALFPTRFSVEWRDTNLWVQAGNTGRPPWPGVGVLSARQNFDPHWSKVALLLRGVGAAGTTGISDLSNSAAAFSLFGAAKVAAAPVKFGPKSIDFGTSGSGNYLQLTNPSLLAFQSQDFTFESWCYFSAATGTAQQLIYHNYTGTFGAGSIFYGKHNGYGGRVVFWSYNATAAVPTLQDPTLPPSSTWVHYAVCRKGSTFTLRRDGVVVDTATFAGSITGVSVADGYVSTGVGSFIGLIEDLRVTVGVDRYASGGLIPTYSAPPDPSFVANPTRMVESAVILFQKELLPPSPTTLDSPLLQFLDTEFGGNGRVYGNVERKNTPANAPLVRRVRLIRSRDGTLIRETWSKADGTYEFKGISMNYEYDTVAWDHEMLYRTVVANNLKPEAM